MRSFTWLASPPIALALFLGLFGGLYWISGRLAARSDESPGKRLPYACGEDLLPAEIKPSYHGFFRLALVFIVAHMAALVLATLPLGADARPLATAYLLGIAVCIDALVHREG